MAIDLRFMPPRPAFEHTGKRPRYLVQEGEWSKAAGQPHAVDATTNAQGDWVCHVCGEQVRVVVGSAAPAMPLTGEGEPPLSSQP